MISTTDCGSKWENNLTVSNDEIIAYDACDENVGLLTNSTLFLSKDSGITWDRFNVPANPECIKIVNKICYILTDDSLYRLKNNNWIKINVPFSSPISSINAYENQLVCSSDFDVGFYNLSNNSWVTKSISTGYVVTNSSGVFMLSDGSIHKLKEEGDSIVLEEINANGSGQGDLSNYVTFGGDSYLCEVPISTWENLET